MEDRCRLMVKNLDSGKVRQITDGSQHYSTGGYMEYSWSPDSKWFVVSYTGNRHDPYSDVDIISARVARFTTSPTLVISTSRLSG